jgi:hypothetical protein
MISAAILEPKISLIVKQSQNIGKMLATLNDIYNPAGEHSSTFDELIKDLVCFVDCAVGKSSCLD